MFAKAITFVALLAATVQGSSVSKRQDANSPVNQIVLVGNNGSLTYDPPQVTASINSTITFVFSAKNHTATQSTFDDPCNPVLNGLDTGFNQVVAANATELPTVTIRVDTEDPVWFHCAQTITKNHCQAGMVFAVNPTPNKTFDAFLQNAINSANTTSS